MRILRVRRGFQADHSSSSYLFYAVDRPVSAEGKAIAHRYSSRAEVSGRTARYHKWGESSLSYEAYEELLGEHYDVMVSESYDWWTLMIAVPKTPEMEELFAPFADARGYDDLGVDVVQYGEHFVAEVSCAFDGNGVGFLDDYGDDDALETLKDLLVKVRSELLRGDTSFLEAVASFYGGLDSEEEEPKPARQPAQAQPGSLASMSKSELQRECEARGITVRKSWTKTQLRNALTAPAPKSAKGEARKKTLKLSKAAQAIVEQMERI